MLLLLASFATADARPTLSGPAQTVGDGRFLVHYTVEGGDAPTGPRDGEGVPELVHRVLAALPEAEARFLADGWRPLVGDDGAGGSEAIDVYVQALERNGWAHPTGSADGTDDACYLRISAALGGQAGQVPESVVFHELHHCVQYRYTTTAHLWLYEATATHEQYRDTQGDPVLDLALDVLWNERLTHPDRPLDDLTGRHPYAGFVFTKFWEDATGTAGALPRMWEALARAARWEEGLHAAALEEPALGGLEEAFLTHGVWNAFACGSRAGDSYYRADSHPCRAEVAAPSVAVDEALSVHLTDRWTYAVFEHVPADPSRGVILTCDSADGRIGLALSLGASGPPEEAGSRAWFDLSGGAATLRIGPPGPDGTVVIVAAAADPPPAEVSCVLAPTDPIEDGEDGACGCASAPGAGAWLVGVAALALRRRATQRGRRASCSGAPSAS